MRGSLQGGGDFCGDFFSEVFGALGGEVDVGRQLDAAEFGVGVGVQVVGGNAGGGHDFGGDLIKEQGFICDTTGAAFWHGSGVAPDEFGTGGFEKGHDLSEIFLVVGEGNLVFGAG